ncbi:MAG: hypothetical protein ACI8RD_001023 [Bacillariaceae sp.]|jgi:hypothetical protein
MKVSTKEAPTIETRFKKSRKSFATIGMKREHVIIITIYFLEDDYHHHQPHVDSISANQTI